MSLNVCCFQVLSEIIQLNDVKQPKEIILNENFDKKIKNFQILKISSKQKDEILEKLIGEEKFENILASVGIEFPFDQEIIEEIPKLETNNKNIIDFVSIRVLYMTIPWIYNIKCDSTEDYVLPMLSSYVFVMKSSFQNSAKKCYKKLFDGIFNIDKFYRFNICVPELQKYLHIDPSPDFMCYILGKTINSNADPTDPFFSQVLESFGSIIMDNPEIFDGKLSEMISIITKFVFEFNSFAISFFSKLVKYVNDDSINAVVKAMARLFFNIIDEINPIKVEIVKKEFNIEMESTKPIPEFKEKIFSPDFDLKLLPQIPTMQSYLSICGQRCHDLVNLIVIAFKENTKLAQYFVSCMCRIIMKNINKDVFFSEWFSAIEFVHRMKNNLAFLVSRILIHPLVFYEGDTVFNPSKSFDVINTLRWKAIEVLLDSSYNVSFETCLIETSKSPFIFAETCLRLILRNNKIIQKLGGGIGFISLLMDVSIVYQKLFYKYDYEGIIEARRASFSLIANFLLDKETRINFFNDQNICSAFVSFLYEPNLSLFVNKAINNYLLNEPSEKLIVLITNLINTFNDVAAHFPLKQAVILASDVLENLNETFSFNKELRNQIADICKPIPSLYKKLEPNEECRRFVKVSIMFLANMVPFYSISNDGVSALIEGTKKIQNDSFLKSLRFNLHELLAGEILSSENCNFRIKSYQIPSIFLHIYFDTDFIKQVLEDFIKLCDYSSYNIYVLGSCGFCLTLLDFLKKAKMQSDTDEEIVQKMLDLFSLICSAKTTPQIILKYIELISPTPDGTESKFHDLFFNTFNRIVQDSHKHQISYFPLKGNTVLAKNHNFIGNNKGFTFTCWLYLENNAADYRPKLFSLRMGENKLGAFVSNNNIIASISTPENNLTSKISYPIPTLQWTFVSLSYRFFNNRISVGLSIDCSEPEIVTIPKIPITTKVTYKIGGVGNFNNIESPHKMVCPLLLKYTEPKDCSAIQTLGMNPNISEIPNLFYYFDEIKGQIEIKSQFMCSLMDTSVMQALFPIMMDLNESETSLTSFNKIDEFITILMHLLNFSKEAQDHFIESKGFEIMAHIIVSQWKSKFTMKMYSKFANIMSIENKELQKSLFVNILTNFDIITLMEPDSHLKVLNSWSKTLFPYFQDITTELFNYTRILISMRIYYWYPTKDKSKISKREIEFDVKKCREALLLILYEYARQNFDESFFTEIISNIISCDDLMQSIDLLELLCNIIENKFAKFSFEEPKIQRLMLMILTIKNQKINAYGFRIFSLLKAQGYSHEFLEMQIRLLISLYCIEDDTSDIFDSCINEVRRLPELIPFCCYLGRKNGPSSFDKIKKVFLPRYIEDMCTSLLIWPLKMCTNLSEDDKKRMLRILCKCKDKWFTLFDLIDVVCEPYSEDSYELKGMLINVIADLLISKKITSSKQAIDNFYSIVTKFIFFRPKIGKNICIEKLFETFGEKIVETKQGNQELVFSLRFNEEGSWVDASVARRCVDIYLEFNCTNYLPFVLLISSYLQRLKVKGVIPDLAKMALTEKERNEMSEYIDFFSYQTEIAGKKQFFINGKVPTNPNFINTFYETRVLSQLHAQNSDIYSIIQNESQKMTESMESIIPLDLEKYQHKIHEKAARNEIMLQERRNKNRMNWEILWAALSSKEGPWESNKSDKKKRVSDQSFGYVPVKIENEVFHSDFTNGSINNIYIISYPCVYKKLGEELAANFELTHDSIIVNVCCNKCKSTFVIPLAELKAAFLSSRNGNQDGLELITINGEEISLFFNGVDTAEITNTIYTLAPQRVCHIQLSGLCEFVEVANLREKWINGEMSTFEYICLLNRADGRSFECPEHYPIFPLITPEIKDRDFSKVLKLPDARRVCHILSNVEPFKSLSEEEDFVEYGNDFEATPEYYCLPEAFEGNFQLPNWAKDSNDFVYQNRKLLESDEVSKNIHNWFNAMWKFLEKHGPRIVPEKKNQKIKFSAPVSNILSVYFDKGEFTFLQIDGTVTTVHVDFRDESIPLNMNTTKISKQLIFKPKSIIPIDTKSVAIIRNEDPFLQIVTTQGYKKDVINDEYKVLCVSCDGPWMVIGTKNSEIIVFYNNEKRFVIPTFRDSIVTVAVREEFGTIAALTQNGLLIICSLVNGTVSSVRRIGDVIPNKILISKCCGFIICLCTNSALEMDKTLIFVHSINGRLIKETVLEFPVTYSTTFSSFKGIDFIAVGSNEKLMFSEVFFVDEMKTIEEGTEKIVFIDYDDEISYLITVGNKGRVSAIPF